MQTVGEVKAFIEADERASRNVRLLFAERANTSFELEPASVANTLVQEFGFHPISPHSWSVLDQAAALSIASRILGEDLAYKSELFSPKTALFVARSLMNALAPYETSFLCNAEFRGTSVSWDPIGTSTFEVALVGFDKSQAFLLYADAED